MDNWRVPVRSVCPVLVLIDRVKMKSRQEKEGREEKDENPYTPGW